MSRPQDRALFAGLLYPAHAENGQVMAANSNEEAGALPMPASS
jgi:hypothetical protein